MTDRKRPAHSATFCERSINFSGSMARHCGQWVSKHVCPQCGRASGWMADNYLSGGKMVCTGERFFRPHEQNAAKLGWDNMRALLAR